MSLRLVPAPASDPADELAEMCARGARGDRAAQGWLYRRFAKDVARWAFQLVGHDRDLDDLVQETFLVAFRKLGEVKEPAKVRSWLASIATNLTRKRFQLSTRRGAVLSDLTASAPVAQDPRALGELEVLYQQLAQLEPELKEPWVLRRLCDEDLTVVAEMCSVSLATAKRRIAEADAWLERRLAP